MIGPVQQADFQRTSSEIGGRLRLCLRSVSVSGSILNIGRLYGFLIHFRLSLSWPGLLGVRIVKLEARGGVFRHVHKPFVVSAFGCLTQGLVSCVQYLDLGMAYISNIMYYVVMWFDVTVGDGGPDGSPKDGQIRCCCYVVCNGWRRWP
eukprot:scaffold172955_cov35-Tisochrysis_lutea.AAC.1